MLTLFSTLISFLSGGLPKILDIFQDRQDKKHEIEMAQMQMDQQMRMQAAGFSLKNISKKSRHIKLRFNLRQMSVKLYMHMILRLGKAQVNL